MQLTTLSLVSKYETDFGGVQTFEKTRDSPYIYSSLLEVGLMTRNATAPENENEP